MARAPVLPAAARAAPESGKPAADDRGEARSGDSIGSLLAEPLPGGTGAAGSSGRALYRMLGWTAALALAALCGLRIFRRVAPGRAARGRTGTGGGIRVVSRTALTSRHSLFTVRVGSSRLLVVGVSGDRITPVSEIEDPAQVMALDPSFARALDRAGGGEPGLAPETGPADGPDRIAPFRAEVGRIREVVRGWRARLEGSPRGEAAGPSGG